MYTPTTPIKTQYFQSSTRLPYAFGRLSPPEIPPFVHSEFHVPGIILYILVCISIILAMRNQCDGHSCMSFGGHMHTFPRSVFAGTQGRCMSNFIRNCQTVFQSDYINLLSHQQCVRVPIVSHPYQHLVLPILLILVTEWYLTMILICISLMTNETEQLFVSVFDL